MISYLLFEQTINDPTQYYSQYFISDAKEYRDTKMKLLAKQYPEYSFENHVGYGTSAHYEAIKKHGFTELHRKTFLKSLSISL